MERPWPYFWFTLAAMTSCALISAAITTSAPKMNMGSVADWFSGCAAAGAAITALYIANRDARRASDLRIEQQAEQARTELLSDQHRLKTILALLDNGITTVDSIYDEIRSGKDPQLWAKSFIVSGNGRATSDGLAEIKIDTFTDTFCCLTLVNSRRMWSIQMAAIEAIAGGEKPSGKHLNTDALKDVTKTLAEQIVCIGGDASKEDTKQVAMLLADARERLAAAAKSV